MQLNGTNTGPTMAASEPPEPPPRNPDKINASLKQMADSKSATKSLDTSDRPTSNNNKLFKPILSLDNNTPTTLNTLTSSSLTAAATSSILTSAASATSATTFTTISGSTSLSSSTITNKLNDNSCLDNNHQQKAQTTIVNTSNLSQQTFKDQQQNDLIVNGGLNSNCDGSNLNSVMMPAAVMDTSSNKTMTTQLQTTQSTATNQPYSNDKCLGNEIGAVESLSNDSIKQQFLCTRNAESVSDNSSDGCNRNDGGCGIFKNGVPDLESPQTSKLRQENEKLSVEINRLRKLLENSPDGAVGGIDFSDSNSFDAHSTDGSSSRVERLEAELKLAKEHVTALKTERKKLRSDKNDLLIHVKQLCSSLQEKEQELRDFIRNFEHRIRENESNAAKMTSERERERWSLLKHARDEAERSLALAAQLNAKDIQLQRTQEQLQEARRQLSGCLSDQESLISMPPLTPPSGLSHHLSGPPGSYMPNDRGSCSADSGVRGSSDRESAAGDYNLSDGPCENGPCITVDPDSISLVSSHHNMYQYGTPKERSPTLSPLNSAAFSRSIDSGALSSRSVEQLGSPVDAEGPPINRRLTAKSTLSSLTGRSGRGGTWGSISRVFARSRHRTKNSQPETEPTDYQWNPMTEEGYAEKLRLLREASTVPMERWRASQVLAWLEVALGMPQYSTRCTENVKSGKVLLELSDGELETGLGLTHPMHRKKLRLAIEEHRRPDLVRYPTIGQLGHTWVASEWLPDIGLPQYVDSFLHSLVDARMLDTLSKKELEKFLGVTRKFHQASIVHGIHVLRILKYDRQSLAMRRLQCDNVDADPIVWTNQRFIRWARSIDLGEYAENLKDSGVHGGLVVLEPSFTGETMATALGIPPSKNIIRRHLGAEFESLILPARANLGQGIRTGGCVVPITGPGGLQSSTIDRRSSGSMRFASWKGSQGSLYKAFRFNKPSRSGDKNQMGSSTSPTPSYSSSEGGIYSTIGLLNQTPPPPPTSAPPPPPSHRVSAPPLENASSTLPRYAQHRRVKSISDIEVVAATPV